MRLKYTPRFYIFIASFVIPAFFELRAILIPLVAGVWYFIGLILWNNQIEKENRERE